MPNFSDKVELDCPKTGKKKTYVSEDQVRVFLEHELGKYKDAVDQIFGLCLEAKEQTEIIFQPKV